MDLSSPLQSLIPTLDAVVLEVLAGTESGLSATQITRLASRGSRAGLSLALDRLVEAGIVIAEPANVGYLYRLNREHVLAESVLVASDARRRIVQRLTAAVEALDPQPIHVSVFGSFARREAGPTSDIDLLVVVPDGAPDDDWSEQMHGLSSQVLAWTGNRLEYLVFTVSELEQLVEQSEPVLGSWLKDGRLLHGDPLERIAGIGESAGTVDR